MATNDPNDNYAMYEADRVAKRRAQDCKRCHEREASICVRCLDELTTGTDATTKSAEASCDSRAVSGYAAAVTKLREMARESSERAFAYKDTNDWEGYKRCLAEYNLLQTAAAWLEESEETGSATPHCSTALSQPEPKKE